MRRWRGPFTSPKTSATGPERTQITMYWGGPALGLASLSWRQVRLDQCPISVATKPQSGPRPDQLLAQQLDPKVTRTLTHFWPRPDHKNASAAMPILVRSVTQKRIALRRSIDLGRQAPETGKPESLLGDQLGRPPPVYPSAKLFFPDVFFSEVFDGSGIVP